MGQTVEIIFSDKLTKLKPLDRAKIQMGVLEWMFGDVDTKPEWPFAVRLNGWKIHFHESSESNLAEYQALVGNQTLSSGIPHGITNVVTKEIHVFIPDGSGDLFVRQAHDAASHEICHMQVAVLVQMGKLPQRMKRQYQDKLNKPGTEGNTHTVLVHDRDYEDSNGIRPRRIFKIYKYRIGPFTIGSLQLSGIDISDVINDAF